MAERKQKQRLIVVESPAKAKTIGKYLGSGYRVKASVGHIRDLPERELGVDIEKGFEPTYVTIRGKGKIIQELRQEAQKSSEILLATDPDREGEAIAYHVAEQLGYDPDNGKSGPTFRRVLFHEITRDAVQRALAQPGTIDMRKVEAQQARRILDRLVGYQASPLLWKPIRPGLSAGRVQTVALRLIAEREDEIRAFKPEEYWSITAQLEKQQKQFEAKLHHIDGKAFRIENESAATDVLADVRGLPFEITEIKRRERLKNAPAPFTTSTLQQEAAKRLGFSAQRTMRTAQQLYEGIDMGGEAGGLITYMRTDSTRVSAAAAGQAQDWIGENFGKKYLAEGPRLWGGKQQKGAQEAHEAIRPTDATRRPEDVASYLERDQLRLYELIWLRFVAGQMAPAVYDTTTVDFDLEGKSGRQYLFRATGSIVKFDGFTRLYQEAREEGDHRTLDDLMPLPPLDKGERCKLIQLLPAQHFTQPPPRFTEASLVKELERLGIGRPSTYASIISTLVDREYVKLEQKRFEPTPLGETVAHVLVRIFPDIFEVTFTSEMEAELDRIEEGELEWRGVLTDFYKPFLRQLKEGKKAGEELVREAVSADAVACPDCGKPMIVRWNRFGRFLGCSGYPECRHTQPIDEKERREVKSLGEPCPNCGSDLVERQGRFGPFVACSNYPKCKYTRPRTIPGLVCPKCSQGEIGEKRTRRGKAFWGCTRYPECDWSSWDRPVAGPCPECKSLLLVQKSTKTKGDYIKCPQCSTEFTQAESGALEFAASPQAGGPRSPRKAPLRKTAARKTSAPAEANGAAATRKSAPRSAPGKAATKAASAKAATKADAAKTGVSKSATTKRAGSTRTKAGSTTRKPRG